VALLLRRPAVAEMAVDVLLCAVPIWAAVMIGLAVGWSWRPRWTGLLFLGLRSRLRILWLWVPPGLGARRLWLACTALSACSVAPRLLSSAFRRRRSRLRGKRQDKASPEDHAAAAPDGGGCADGRSASASRGSIYFLLWRAGLAGVGGGNAAPISLDNCLSWRLGVFHFGIELNDLEVYSGATLSLCRRRFRRFDLCPS
jgi:hypothetical protein